MNGAWILPTRRRIAELTRFCDAAVATGVSTPGWIVVRDREYAELRAQYEAIALPAQWQFVQTEAEGMGDKFRELWPRIAKLDWMGWVVDDVIPQTQGWDRTLVSGLNGWNIISCNDGARAPLRMHCPAMSGALLRAVGYVYWDGFWHAYMDDAWERLGRATDTWWVCMDVLLKHEDAFQTGKADETHTRSYGRMREDQMALAEWRRREMDGAVRRVMRLKRELQQPARKIA